jgi:hypothetical protein
MSGIPMCQDSCRIKESTKQDILEEFPVLEFSHVFFDAKVLLGTVNVNQTQTPVRLVGYVLKGKSYWVANLSL